EGEIEHRTDEDLAAAHAVGKPAPDIRADDGADPGAHQDCCRLTEGELPRPDQECEHEADQKEIEKFQSIADNRGSQDLDLISCQPLPSFESIEHDVPPERMFIF